MDPFSMILTYLQLLMRCIIQSNLAAPLLSNPAVTKNVFTGPFIPAGLGTQGFLAPRALGTRHSNRGSAFTTTVRMVPGGHRRSTDGGTDTQVAFPACFSKFDIAMIDISNLANCRHAVLQNQSDFT